MKLNAFALCKNLYWILLIDYYIIFYILHRVNAKRSPQLKSTRSINTLSEMFLSCHDEFVESS